LPHFLRRYFEAWLASTERAAAAWGRRPQAQEVILYKESKDSKLGVTFYRRDPQEGGVPEAAIISRLGATGPAVGKLFVGERIMSVQGQDVQGPLHAARLLRESEGYLKIKKLPKRADFDAKYEEYAQIEAENARKAIEAAQPGQAPQATPRTDAATPRGPGAGAPGPLLTGLKVINGPGAPSSSAPAPTPPPGGLNIAAGFANFMQGAEQNFGQLSARAKSVFESVAEAIPTEENRLKKELRAKNRAATRIQKCFRAYKARGQFHEERGASLMLQAAVRRRQAQAELKLKKDNLRQWAATKIQSGARHMIYRKKKSKAEERKRQKESSIMGQMGKMARSLSFTKRNQKKESSTPRASDAAPPAASEPAAEGTLGKMARSLSFTRRTKKPEAAAEAGAQNV